jgi:MarR family 2-MHQ and catechol resistance regulon transcriptional repressor
MSPTSVTRRSAAQDRALKLFVVLERAAQSVVRGLQRNADLQGLTHTEFEILEALYHKGPLLLGDVQKKVLLTSGGVTYTVDRLAEKGLVERRECETDRRARWAALTPKGESVMSKIFPPIAKQIEETMSVLSAREQDEAIAALRKLGLNAASAAE